MPIAADVKRNSGVDPVRSVRHNVFVVDEHFQRTYARHADGRRADVARRKLDAYALYIAAAAKIGVFFALDIAVA